MIRNQEQLQISYLHNFLIFYETHFNAKIEHEDNFFIELDLLSTKNNCPSLGIDPTIQHVGPAPCGGGLQLLPVLLD